MPNITHLAPNKIPDRSSLVPCHALAQQIYLVGRTHLGRLTRGWHLTSNVGRKRVNVLDRWPVCLPVQLTGSIFLAIGEYIASIEQNWKMLSRVELSYTDGVFGGNTLASL